MTIKELIAEGFTVTKQENRKFIISRDKIKVTIEKITDTKFRFSNNEPTTHISTLLEQIKNSK